MRNESANPIYIPEFLAVDDSGISVLDICMGQYCGQSGCCRTECSMYCMSDQNCGQSCEQCGQPCEQGGCCTTECSEYCMSAQGCKQGCGESCSESCSESCGQGSTSPSFSLSGVTANSVIVHVDVVPAYPNYGIFCRLASNPDDVTYSSGAIAASSSFSRTIPGLSPSTAYLVNVSYSIDPHFPTWMGAQGFTTLSLGAFDWTYAGLNSSGTPVSGVTKVSGYGIYVTANEWNRLVDAIKAKTGATISKVSSGQSISASIMNQARSALGLSSVSQGQTISAAHFNQLRTAVNN